MKRTAERQITQDDREEDEEEEPEGTGFQQASAEALSGRKIRGLPKRRAGTSTPSDTESAPKPTFGGFGGFGTTPAPTSNGKSETPTFKAPSFAGFSGFGSNSTPGAAGATGTSAPSFTFSAPAAPAPSNAPSKTSQPFGTSAATSNVFAQKSSMAFTFGNTSGLSASKPAAAPTPSQAAKPDILSKDVEYYSSLRGLNHSLITALEEALKKDPFVQLPLESITKAYTQFRKEIEEKSSPPKPSLPTPTAPADPPKPPAFSMPKPPTGGFFNLKPVESTTMPATAPTAPSLPFSFGAPKAAPEPSNAASGAAKSTFSFGSSGPKPSDPPASTDSKPAEKPKFSFGTPSVSSFGSTPAPNPFAPKPDIKDPTTTSGPSGITNLFAAKSDDSQSSKKEEEKKPSLYPFGMLGDSKSPLAPPAAPKPAFFSFGTSPATTPAATPPAPESPEKRPSLSSSGFSFGSAKGSFSFGAATPKLTPAGGSLGNPVGFAFGSPPKDPLTAGTITPTPGTSAGLAAATAAADPFVKPTSTVASLAGSDAGSSRDDTPTTEPAVPAVATDEDIEGEGEEDETNIFSERAKLYRYKANNWVDMGVGRFKLKKHKATGLQRILMRTEHGRLLLNFRMHAKLEAQVSGKPTIIKFNGHDEGQPALYQVRFKTADVAASTLKILQDIAKEV